MDESGASAHAACLPRPPGRRRLTACRRSGVSALSFVPAYIAANNAAYTNTCVASRAASPPPSPPPRASDEPPLVATFRPAAASSLRSSPAASPAS
jgi:hypothetical protein